MNREHLLGCPTNAYQPFTTGAEAESIRLETEWRREMSIAIDAAATENREHRRRAAVVAWLVGSALVGLMAALFALFGVS